MLDIISNGKIIAAFSGLDIECVRGNNYCSFPLCSLYAENDRDFLVEKENHLSVVRRHIRSKNGCSEIWISDFCDESEPVFIRREDILSCTVLYRIKNSPDSKIYFIDSSYAVISNGRECMCIRLKGNCAFDGVGIRLFAGVSYICFVFAFPYELPYLSENRISPEGIYKSANARKLPDVTEKLAEAVLLQSAMGAIIKSPASPNCLISEQENYLRIFLKHGHYERARKIIDFIISVYDINGFIPYAVSPAGECITDAINHGALFPSTVAICALEYMNATGDGEYIASVLKKLAEITMLQCECFVGAHLPFTGRENIFSCALIPMSGINCGSLLSDTAFIESANALCELSDRVQKTFKGRKGLERLAKNCKEHLSDYENNGELFLNYKKRYFHASKQASIVCRCEYCSAFFANKREELCYLNKKKFYVCLSCFGDVEPEGLPVLGDIEIKERERRKLTETFLKEKT